MPIPYYLQDNPATPDPNDQTARVATKDNLGEDYLATQMVRRGVFPTAGASVSALKTIQEIIAEAALPKPAAEKDVKSEK